MQPGLAGLMVMIAAAAGCQRLVELRTEQTGTSVDVREAAPISTDGKVVAADAIRPISASDLNPPPADTASSNTVSSSNTPVPDNTAINQRDFDGRSMTPMDQKENSRDLGITAHIRKSIVATEGLSVNARNIKVITAEGKVTLRGPVNSETERSVIARIATEIAGEGNVANQLEVSAGRNSEDGG